MFSAHRLEITRCRIALGLVLLHALAPSDAQTMAVL